MLAARMHGYRQPLVLEEVNILEISSDQVLVRVGSEKLECVAGTYNSLTATSKKL